MNSPASRTLYHSIYFGLGAGPCEVKKDRFYCIGMFKGWLEEKGKLGAAAHRPSHCIWIPRCLHPLEQEMEDVPADAELWTG